MESESSSSNPDSQSSNEQTRSGDTKAADAARVEVSAPTIARMMGIATVTELKLLENRIDLLAAKVGGMTAKLDRVI